MLSAGTHTLTVEKTDSQSAAAFGMGTAPDALDVIGTLTPDGS